MGDHGAWSQRELHDSQSAVYNHDRSTNEAGQVRIDRLPSRFLPKAQEPGIAALIAQCRASGTARLSKGQMRPRSLLPGAAAFWFRVGIAAPLWRCRGGSAGCT